MGEIDLPRWTPALMLAELRRALRRPVISAPSLLALAPEPEEALPGHDMVALSERYLGRTALERKALLILARPPGGLSIRETCRQCVGWHRSRPSLYRQARRGARIIAKRLNEEGTPPPDHGSSTLST